MAGGNVEKLLGGSRALMSQLVNQGLIGDPRQESSNDVSVGDIGQLVVLPGEALDVPMKGFRRLLSVVFEISSVPRMRVHALEVPHEDLL